MSSSLYSFPPLRHLRSFPTRRSSDLRCVLSLSEAIPPSAAPVEALDGQRDRKSTRLNSSHVANSYAGFCVKKKKGKTHCNGRAALETSARIRHRRVDFRAAGAALRTS